MWLVAFSRRRGLRDSCIFVSEGCQGFGLRAYDLTRSAGTFGRVGEVVDGQLPGTWAVGGTRLNETTLVPGG